MKIKIMAVMIGLALIATSAFAADGDLIVNGKLGVGTTAPAAKVDVNGEVKIGNTGLACSSTTAGATRYSSGRLEYCNGTIWGPVNDNTIPLAIAGNYIVSVNQSIKYVNNTTWTTYFTFTIYRAGTWRIGYTLLNNDYDYGSYIYGRVLKNGVQISTTRTLSNGYPAAHFTEDISGLNVGDQIVIQSYQTIGSGSTYWGIGNVRLSCGNPVYEPPIIE